MPTLILPGLNNSGPEHRQSRRERMDATCVRVHQQERDAPRCADWVATLDATQASLDGEAVLVW
jgi:predicted alpha/beta hydrolase family esterase